MADAEVYRVWLVWKTTDESGHKGDFVGAYTTEKKAVIAAEGNGFFDSVGKIEESSMLKVGGRFYLLASPDPVELDKDSETRRAELRASGLSKLTSAECEALGLPKPFWL